MSSNYVIWDSKAEPNGCVLKELIGVEKDYQLRKGVPFGASFPAEAAFTMDPDFPDNTLLTDNLLNTDLMIVASLRLKQFLDQQGLPKVEYLPVTVLNHKGRPASRDYFIVHPIDPVECLDLDKCQPTWSAIDKTSIKRLKKLVLDESKIEKDRRLFRPKGFHRVILAHQELAKAIGAQGFTGINWVPVDRYK